MSDHQPPENDLIDEFRTLGKNLVEALRAAWDSPERKKLESEISTGLNDLANTLNREAQSFKESPTGQQLKSDLEDLRQRMHNGEVENQVRSELLGALRTVNQELQKVASRWGGGSASPVSPPDREEPPGKPGQEL
jgi:predicted  nucleic acid-binding Zn-ribbon protein